MRLDRTTELLTLLFLSLVSAAVAATVCLLSIRGIGFLVKIDSVLNTVNSSLLMHEVVSLWVVSCSDVLNG